VGEVLVSVRAGLGATLVLGLLWATPAVAELQGVGSEAAVGANGTGEACRVRVVQEDAARGSQRLQLYCDGWSVASGTLFRFRVSREFTPERLLTDSTFQRGYETRLGGCTPVEPTTLGDGTAAAIRQCYRLDRGWPVVVLGAVAAGRGMAMETFPTNTRLLESTLAALQGGAAGAARGGRLSPAIRRAETIVGASGKLVGIQDIGAAETLWRLGKLQYRSGNYAQGEATFARMLEIHERVLGPDRPGAAAILNELALTQGHQGRFDDADKVFDRAEKAARYAFVQDEAILNLAYRASVNRDHRPAEALQWAERAVKLAEAYPETRRGRPFSLAIHAVVLRTNKRAAEAEATAARALAMFERPGEDPDWRLWWIGELRELLGRLAYEARRFPDARREYGLALAQRELLFGEAAPRAIESRVSLGMTEQAAGDLEAALTHLRQAAALQIKHRTALEGARLPSVLSYLDALSRAIDERPADRAALAAEMLGALQIPRGSETAKALRAMAARVGSGDPALAALTRDLQDVGRRRAAARASLAEDALRAPEQREVRQEDLKRQLREAEERIEALETQLQAEFPRYARLTAERPLMADEVRALLRPDEALLAILPGHQSTYVVLARRDGVRHHRARLGRSALETEVKALRASLDLSAGESRAFDVARSRALYTALLGPLDGALADVRHLLTVPAGPLLALPLGVLVTDAPPAGSTERPSYLASRVALSVLPSVAALRNLRAVAARSPAPQPFIGFADPAFGDRVGEAGKKRGAASAAATSSAAVTSVSAVANLCRQGETLDPALLRGLPRLPESADEVRRIASALGAGADAVVLGTTATERRVRETDLARYRVVAFATHGLLPGELRCQAEPALALTPPAAATRGEDGLLDASEVATLKLDADWVVLSACNTAGPDGTLGGESLSGLTRAFFYAGARALLVSHWAVASGPTVDLTTAMFAAYTSDRTIGKAEALRRAQAALQSRPGTTHPFFWAPFVVVGDGGSTP
jgi:CHAT domain-containing protein